VTVRKSTRVWLGVFAVSLAASVILHWLTGDSGCFGAFLAGVAVLACFVLAVRGIIVLFRLVIRRTTLRLAFSYFLIGILPIPLLAALLLLGNYIEAHQFMATRVRREVTALGEAAAAKRALPRVAADPSGRVVLSEVPWLKPGQDAGWLGTLARPAFLGVNGQLWLAVPEPGGARAARVLRFDDPDGPWLQDLADRTGYEVLGQPGDVVALEQRHQHHDVRRGAPRPRAEERFLRLGLRAPRGRAAAGPGIWNGEWIRAFYLETVANAPAADEDAEQDVAILKARSSPHNVEEQLFTQGVKDIARAARLGFLGWSARSSSSTWPLSRSPSSSPARSRATSTGSRARRTRSRAATTRSESNRSRGTRSAI
jgi:hypothetical protein